MSEIIKCPFCSKKNNIPDNKFGLLAKCGACGRIMNDPDAELEGFFEDGKIDREEYLKTLAMHLAEIEYPSLLSDPEKMKAVISTSYNTACLRPGNAVRTVVRGLRAKGLHREAAEIAEQGEVLGIVTREDAAGNGVPLRRCCR